MPRKDKTGPDGKGPKTGRSMGLCNGLLKKTPLKINKQGQERGQGRGRGKLD